MRSFLIDSDSCLFRSVGWATDIWAPGARAWRAWPTDWSAARLNEISPSEAQAIAGAGADLDQPAAAA